MKYAICWLMRGFPQSTKKERRLTARYLVDKVKGYYGSPLMVSLSERGSGPEAGKV